MNSRKMQMLALLLIVFSLNNMTAAGLGAPCFDIEELSLFFSRSSLQAPSAAKTIPQSSSDTRECSSTPPSEVIVSCESCLFGPVSEVPPSVEEWQTSPAGSGALSEQDSDFVAFWKKCIMEKKPGEVLENLKRCAAQRVLECPQLFNSKENFEQKCEQNIGFEFGKCIFCQFTSVSFISCMPIREFINELFEYIDVDKELQICEAEHPFPVRFYMPLKRNSPIEACLKRKQVKKNSPIEACLKNEQEACKVFSPRDVLFIVTDTPKGGVVKIMPSMLDPP